MENNNIKIKDLVLAAFLKLRGHSFSIEKIGEVGYFTFGSEAREDIDEFYGPENDFKKFHNNIRDIKQHVKSL